MAININNSSKLYTTQYSNLRGVDFSSGAENVHERRTPTGTNLISDEGGNPKKRFGWCDYGNLGGEGDFVTLTYNGVEHLLAYASSYSEDLGVFEVGILRYNDSRKSFDMIFYETISATGELPFILFKTPTDTDSVLSAIVFDKLYEYKYVPTSSLTPYQFVEVEPYVPLVSIGGQAESGGGTSYESFNLATKKIRESFITPSSYTYLGDNQTAIDTAKATDDRTYTTCKQIQLSSKVDTSKPVKVTIKSRSINKTLGTSSKYTYTFGSTHDVPPREVASSGSSSSSSSDMITDPTEDDNIIYTQEIRECIGYEAETVYSYNGSTWYKSKRFFGYNELGDYEPRGIQSGTTTDISFNSTNTAIIINNTTGYVFYPYVDGEDNVEVEYTIADENGTYAETQNAFKSCTTTCIFDERTWFTGAKGDYGNRVWYSDITHNDYFPELNYIVVGSNDTDVTGLCNLGEYLGVIKQPSVNESTTYLAYPTTFDNDRTYATKTYVSGVGAIAPKSFASAESEVLFLSSDGIYGLNTSKIYNRSWYLNEKLLKEPNLENAVAVMYDRYYILSVNGHCYILDTRQKLSWGTEYTNYLYAGYYWENVPAESFAVYGGRLWFNNKNTKLTCRFKTSSDTDCYKDNTTPVYCEWTTPLDDDGSPQLYKTLEKKGAVVTLTHYPSTSAKIELNIDDNKTIEIGEFSADPTDEDNAPLDCFIKKKVKKYKRLQFKISNNKNEPFKIESITKTYSVKGYAKKKNGDGVVRSDE